MEVVLLLGIPDPRTDPWSIYNVRMGLSMVSQGGYTLVSLPSWSACRCGKYGICPSRVLVLVGITRGLAGYDRQGNVSEDGVLDKVVRALQKAKESGKKTEIFVVGHSLGGAVSWYVSFLDGTYLVPPFNRSF